MIFRNVTHKNRSPITWAPVFVFVLLGACSKAPAPATPAEHGRQVYLSNCTACHSPNPQVDGPVGPAIAGSSRALIEARLMRAEYPAGYVPKRNTRAMPAMPHLKDDIEALAAYLGQP